MAYPGQKLATGHMSCMDDMPQDESGWETTSLSNQPAEQGETIVAAPQMITEPRRAQP